MQTVTHNSFIIVKTEGGILPAELLHRPTAVAGCVGDLAGSERIVSGAVNQA